MKVLIKQLEWFLRHFLVYPVLRLLFRNPAHEGTIDLRTVRRVLFLRYDRIGDMIVTTPLFRKLKKSQPEIEIGVFASPSNAEIIRFNPHIDHVHILHRNWWKLGRDILEARRLGYDVVLNLVFNRTTTGALLANVISPDGIKVGQGNEKYRFYFNKLLSLRRATVPMVAILADYFQQVFGVGMTEEEMRYQIVVDSTSQDRVEAFLERRGLDEVERGTFVVANLSAKESYRQMTHDQAVTIARVLSSELNFKTVVICSPEHRSFRRRVLDECNDDRIIPFPEEGVASLLEIAHLIQRSLFVVTPDTAIVHFASATQTPVLGLFVHAHEDEWLPFRVQSAVVRPAVKMPISAIPTETIRTAIYSFVDSLKQSAQ